MELGECKLDGMTGAFAFLLGDRGDVGVKGNVFEFGADD